MVRRQGGRGGSPVHLDLPELPDRLDRQGPGRQPQRSEGHGPHRELHDRGRSFIALNGGPDFKFNEAISLSVECDGQAEVDRYWDALLAGGGEESVCGWLKDRFGVSWQVVPRRLTEIVNGSDREAAGRAFQAMLGMVRIDVAEIERAARGEPVGAAR